jgi:hypothetical protein
MSADGDGRDVRYGFCARAADRAGFEVGGVMSVISRRFGQLDFFNRPLTGLGWNAQTELPACPRTYPDKDMGRAFQAQEVVSREVGSQLGP